MITFANLYLFAVLFILMSNFIKIVYKDLSCSKKVKEFKSFKKSIGAENNNPTALVLFQLHDQKKIPLDIIQKINSFILPNDDDEYYQALVATIHMYVFYGNRIHIRGRHDVSWPSYSYENDMFGDSSRYLILIPSPLNNDDHILFRPMYKKDTAIIEYLENNRNISHNSHATIKPGNQIPELFKSILNEFLPEIEKEYNFSFNSIALNSETISLINRTYTISTISDIKNLLPSLKKVKNRTLKKALLNQLIIKASHFWHTITTTYNHRFSTNYQLCKTNTIIMHPGLFKKAITESKKNCPASDWDFFFNPLSNSIIQRLIGRKTELIIEQVTLFDRFGTFAVKRKDVGYPHPFVEITYLK